MRLARSILGDADCYLAAPPFWEECQGPDVRRLGCEPEGEGPVYGVAGDGDAADAWAAGDSQSGRVRGDVPAGLQRAAVQEELQGPGAGGVYGRVRDEGE